MKETLKNLGAFVLICFFAGGAVTYGCIAFKLADIYFFGS